MSSPGPLSSPAPLLQNFSWSTVVGLNKTLCIQKPSVAHGLSPESAPRVQKEWEAIRQRKITLIELLDFLRLCHKEAPFLNYNGNVFSELGRRILEVSLLGVAVVRMEAASSLAAHYVAGVLDRDMAITGIKRLLTVDPLIPGDRVTTLKATRSGVVTRILPDGRVAWRPEGRKTELIATSETLLKEKPADK